MSRAAANVAPVPAVEEPTRTAWCIHLDPEGGWSLREIELPESTVAAHTVKSWPSELLSIVFSVLEQRIGRKLVERLDS